MSELPEVLVVTEDVSAAELAAFAQGEGPMPVGAYAESFEAFAARGRVPDCDCGLIACACLMVRPHKLECAFRRSVTCPVAIACDPHGFDVCPKCDPCTCEGPDLEIA